MVDRAYSDVTLARLYDALHPWGPGDEFYLGLAMGAGAVLDIGCGTGRLLGRAREIGHPGRLTGIDPAAAMLVQARRRAPGVEWVLGDLDSARWTGEFDMAVMTGYAFQELLEHEQLRRALHTVREALVPGGWFVFETRNPAVRAWEFRVPEREDRIVDRDGAVVRVWHEVETPVVSDRVTFKETYVGPTWHRPLVSRTTLRFLGADVLDRFLGDAGFVVRRRFGDWGQGPFDPASSPEIISVVQRT
ncbi:class I SAM-dependent methyltransferase [Streptomyces spongiae]|uniref:Class I SAM-dependent methyltransferase n=1 Tax=Streptomyces spongiae TaxID=565072 RepID=A0A5N8XG70_9ACTN|nr:class I SAM-dependent methyltransferase [Streptomyces spongiae]MPY58513.1 class I SAM-dependent methyltransferase [Streptomyces spongiae]